MSSSTLKPRAKRCTINGCTASAHAKGLCNKHLSRLARTGTTKLRRRAPPAGSDVEHFKSKRAPSNVPERKILRLPTARVFLPLLQLVRYKGAKGGRGSGKSHFFAELLVERCLMHPTTRAVCIREKQKSLEQSVKRLIEDKITTMRVNHRFRILKTHIEVLDKRGNARGIIIFMGMRNQTADSIKSIEGYDIAWVEEAQSISMASWTLLRPTIRKPNSEIWCSWNPVSPDDPVDDFFMRSGREDVVVVEANFDDNPWFPDELNADKDYDKRRDIDRYNHVWLGKYQKSSSARVFKNWRIGDSEDFETSYFLKLTPRYGGDWGFSKDPTVGIKIRIDDTNRKLYIEREVWEIGCEIDHSPALFDKLDGGLVRKYPLIADSARPETISYMKRKGYPLIRAARKGVGSVEEGVEFIKTYDVIIHPDCVHTIDEFTHYSYKVDEKTEEILAVLDDRKNHVIDAVRYAVESIRHRKKAGVLF